MNYWLMKSEPGIVGVARVASSSRPDPTQFDPQIVLKKGKRLSIRPVEAKHWQVLADPTEVLPAH